MALADSGIYLRGCPQVQIWDSTETAKFNIGADKGSGGLWNNSAGAPGKDPLVKADKPFGEWNKLRVTMVGSRLWVWLNDQQTVNGAVMENYYDRKQPVQPRGPIQLQTHGGEISWRNVFIREIGKIKDVHTWSIDGKVIYSFARTAMTEGESINVTWYDGASRPPQEIIALLEGKPLPDQGSIFIGTEGVLLLPHVSRLELFSKEKFKDYQLPRVTGADH